jgi:hypothetical protein
MELFRLTILDLVIVIALLITRGACGSFRRCGPSPDRGENCAATVDSEAILMKSEMVE